MELRTLRVEAENISNPLRMSIDDEDSDPVEKAILKCSKDVESWLNSHSKVFNGRSENTFVDENGIRRYTDTWMTVDIDPDTMKSNVEDCCGVSRIYFVNDKCETRRIKFLVNWEKLWLSFENDTSDEIGAQSPLLRIFIEFFFHQRTCQLMLFLFVYDTFFIAMIALTADNPLGTGETFAMLIQMVIQIVVYCSLKQLYTGYVLYEKHHLDENDEAETTTYKERRKAELDKIHARKLATKKYSVHWLSTLKQLFLHSYQAVKGLFAKGIPKRKTNKKHNYYNLLNISLKFLIVHNEEKVSDIYFNRLSYRLGLISVLIVLPAYVIYTSMYMNIVTCGFKLHISGYCDFSYFYFIETLGGSMYALFIFLFMGSIFVGFVGLAYGGEVAYQLTNSWLTRYKALRRVNYADGEDRVSDEVNAMFRNSTSNGDNRGSASGSSRPARVDSLRDDRESALNGTTAVYENIAPQELSDEDFSTKVSRDAFEQHLFFSAYMKQAGALWSPIIAGLIIYMLYNCLGLTYYMVTEQESPLTIGQHILYIGVRVIVLLVYPITSIAHANRYLYTVYDTFVMSAPSDYAVLGGRENWTEFLSEVPAVWTLFGLWITWDRIFGMLWTVIVSGVAIGITMVSASL